MSEGIRSIVLGTAGLWIALGVALVLTLTRGRVMGDATQLRTAVRAAIIAVLVQGAHFAEELATGFHRRFPELLGLEPWPAGFFVSFNLFWLAIWGLSIWGLAARRWLALFPLWLLGVASVVNALAHPALSLRAGSYFPGLLSSLFVGIAGAVLLGHLVRVTDGRAGA